MRQAAADLLSAPHALNGATGAVRVFGSAVRLSEQTGMYRAYATA
ncbi:hypothetical protein [Streptomyces sporangiiformans]|nr:hypothetical protein [Streptomyces sporangiiformans]